MIKVIIKILIFTSNSQINLNSIISEPFHLDITKILNNKIDINISNNEEFINKYENK